MRGSMVLKPVSKIVLVFIISLLWPNKVYVALQMLDQVEIGRYLTGFTRYARKLGVRREISYAPYIGHILKTKGLLFQLNDLPTGYIDKIFAENFLIRDVIICLLRE